MTGARVWVNFVCHSRAITSKVSISSASACSEPYERPQGNTMGYLSSGFISLLPGVGKRNFWIGPQRKQFFFSIEAILEPKIFPPVA